MNQIVTLIRKKSHLLLVINSIEKYIKDKYFDDNLKQVWDEYNKELAEIDSELSNMNIPALEEFEQEKLKLRKQIQHHEQELVKLNQQIKELNEISKTLQ
jgi:predicted  nucleic acid-binding Zn-ribbon protein